MIRGIHQTIFRNYATWHVCMRPVRPKCPPYHTSVPQRGSVSSHSGWFRLWLAVGSC